MGFSREFPPSIGTIKRASCGFSYIRGKGFFLHRSSWVRGINRGIATRTSWRGSNILRPRRTRMDRGVSKRLLFVIGSSTARVFLKQNFQNVDLIPCNSYNNFATELKRSPGIPHGFFPLRQAVVNEIRDFVNDFPANLSRLAASRRIQGFLKQLTPKLLQAPAAHSCAKQGDIRWLYGYGSIPINTIFRGMNIHLPAILMFTRGTRFWHTTISWLMVRVNDC